MDEKLIPLHPFGEKKTGTYILSVYKRSEKTRARAEAVRESDLKGDL